MKKIIIYLLLVTGALFSIQAQDQRTRETKIADVVMQLPAASTATFNQLMGELMQLGDVVSDLSPLLADPGGNDAQIRYAISGVTMYASKDASKKAVIARALCDAIAKAKSDEIRDFLFIQLQYVAGNESVDVASGYLNNDRLYDAASRVLIRINNEAASKALLNALGSASGKQQVSLVEALGYVRYQPAATPIAALAGSSDVKMRKAVYHSLAEIASPASEKTLLDGVVRAGYQYDPTDALGSYVLYLGNMIPGHSQDVAKASKKMLKATSEKTQVAARSAALELYTLSDGEKSVNDVYAAFASDNKQYRQAALKYSANVSSPKMFEALMKKVKSEKRPEVKAEIIAALGARQDKDALPYVLESMTNSNTSVRRAAIVAAGKLGKDEVVSPIIKAMDTNDAQVVETGKNTLQSINSDMIVPALANSLSQATPQAKIAFMEIMALRNARSQAGTIFAQTASTDANVRLAAERALKDVVQEKDVPRVAQLLNGANGKDEVAALQDALFAAVASASQPQQTHLVVAQMNAAGKSEDRYYNVLAKIGGKDALIVVQDGFKSTDAARRDAAFEALAGWSDALATPGLYNIAESNPTGAYFDKAIKAYVSKINTSKDTPEQKLLQLRKALEIAGTPEQKQEILRQVARTGTFLGMVTAGAYLDDRDSRTQQTAVQVIRTIALNHAEYYGPVVTDLLNKAIAVNKDPEAEYQKQAILKHMATLPKDHGYVSMFNGKDLSGWKGLVENPVARAKMTDKQLAEKQKKADEIMRRDWRVENGLLVFDGKGYDNLCSDKMYGDFELYVDWRIAPKGDAGIYLRGTPQVQIWDIALTEVGAQVGSGGLYNNQKHQSKPILVADNPVNEWNSFYVKMVGEKVTVYLNGQLVTDNVTLENYWNRAIPIFPKDAIELQAHGTRVEYRDIYVNELPRPEPYEVSAQEKAEGFVPMFNGIDMSGWIGNLKDYVAKDGMIVCDPSYGGRGNLYTDKEYSDFVMRFEFQLTPAANNGLGIRTPLEGDAAYVGMELQILDNEADVYKDLKVYQYHGSVYGVIAAKRGYLKPLGEWNVQEVIADGNHIKITLNGTVILDGNIADASRNFTQTADGRAHPGLSNKSGHIGFLGHGSEVAFKNLRIKDLSKKPTTKKK